jgi:hypothetical protein
LVITGGLDTVHVRQLLAAPRLTIVVIIVAVLTAFLITASATLASHDDAAFDRVWDRTDRPVEEQVVDRTWMWGPAPASEPLHEPYADSPDGERTVMYFDKSRMEVNNPSADSENPWYVTNGLLARDLILGQIQIGDDQFRELAPPEIPVAGDSDDPDGPTYHTFHGVMQQPPMSHGETIIQTIDRSGTVSSDPDLARFGVTAAHIEPATNHSVASVFWEFMHSRGPISIDGHTTEGRLFVNPYYATGFPLTEPYWTQVRVDGDRQHVLVQVFERRVLTYTPGNPDGWTIESGNVGLHYYHWKYAVLDDEPAPHDPEPRDEAHCLDAFEQEFLRLINEYRRANGLVQLESSASLNTASYWHSLDMGHNNYFSHTSLDGSSPFDRMDDAGYTYQTVRAENIAAGQVSAQRVFDVWKASSGHNANMLNPDLRVIGIGRVEVPGSRHGVYWTTKFGGIVDDPPPCT